MVASMTPPVAPKISPAPVDSPKRESYLDSSKERKSIFSSRIHSASSLVVITKSTSRKFDDSVEETF